MAKPDAQALTDSLKVALADIQQPPLADEFFLPPGYLLLALPLLALLGYLLLRFWQRHRRNAARRLALNELAALSLSAPDAANQLLVLLKRYLKTRNPQHPALTMNSRQLTEFLTRTVPLNQPWPELDPLLYGPAPALAHIELFASLLSQWLVQHQEQVLYV